jgi:cytochrome c oxidase subunit 2
MRFRAKMRRWAGVALLALLASVVLSACEKSPSVLDPAGPIATSEANIFWFILGLSTLIFVVVTAVLLYSVFRFRARPDSPAPRQIHGNTKVEIAWTVAPSVILFIVLGITIGTMFALAQPADANTVRVRAVAHQWWWEFQYTAPNGQTVDVADELHMPVGTVVEISLFSDNVIHSMWVPELGGKTDVIPGHDNKMWLKADKAGRYRGECAEYCGTQHAHMDFVAVAEDSGTFQTWLTGQQAAVQKPANGTPDANALAVFQSAGCSGCHVINGISPANIRLIGPNLTHFGSRGLIAGGVLDNNPANLRQWILHAQQVKDGSDMPSFDGSVPTVNGGKALTSDQLDSLVNYLESLQ